MKEWICREMSTSTSGNENGVLMMETELVRCKDCKHQRKEYREDKRRKDGGYNIYWCEFVDGYAPLGFDYEYCAWAERKEENESV